MEQNLGKSHSVSPFESMYTKYGISTKNEKNESAQTPEKKMVPTPDANKKQQKK